MVGMGASCGARTSVFEGEGLEIPSFGGSKGTSSSSPATGGDRAATVAMGVGGRHGFALTIEELSVSLDTSCSRLSDGSLYCWGDNQYGQVGDGTFTDQATPVRVREVHQAVGIATSGVHTCAISKDGTVRCWGMGEQGQLGTGDLSQPKPIPSSVPGIVSAIHIALGPNHSCAALRDGTARCWGINPYGELGDGTTRQRPVPTAVLELSGATRLSAGDDRSCAVLFDGTLRCWGYNADGQLADGTRTTQLKPVAVLGLVDVVQVEVGKWDICSVLGDSSVFCWGINGLEYDGGSDAVNEGPSAHADTPSKVAFLSGTTQLSVGPSHTCARLKDGRIKCVGSNRFRQLGIEGSHSGPAGDIVPNLPAMDQVEVGLHHTCARSKREVWCWGQSNRGQVGDGVVSDLGATPRRVMNLP